MSNLTSPKRALLVLTSHAQLGDTGRGTGFYYDEMATPYWALVDSGFLVDIASVAGGTGRPDPKTVVEKSERPPMVARFMDDEDAMAKLDKTLIAADINSADYDCVFLPGGHGTMWDFDTATIGQLVSDA